MRLLFLFLAFLIPLYSAPKKEKRSPVGSVLTSSPSGLTVVIDAGHGGTARGACGKLPFCEEKRVCLQTARLVKKDRKSTRLNSSH